MRYLVGLLPGLVVAVLWVASPPASAQCGLANPGPVFTSPYPSAYAGYPYTIYYNPCCRPCPSRCGPYYQGGRRCCPPSPYQPPFPAAGRCPIPSGITPVPGFDPRLGGRGMTEGSSSRSPGLAAPPGNGAPYPAGPGGRFLIPQPPAGRSPSEGSGSR